MHMDILRFWKLRTLVNCIKSDWWNHYKRYRCEASTTKRASTTKKKISLGIRMNQSKNQNTKNTVLRVWAIIMAADSNAYTVKNAIRLTRRCTRLKSSLDMNKTIFRHKMRLILKTIGYDRHSHVLVILLVNINFVVFRLMDGCLLIFYVTSLLLIVMITS